MGTMRMKSTLAQVLAVGVVLGVGAPMVCPLDAEAALVICQRKQRVKIRVDLCKGKEVQVPASDLGVTGPEGPVGPAGPGAVWALVAADGSIIAQSGGVSVTTTTGSGGYYVDFGASVAGKLILTSSSDVDQAYSGTVLAVPCGGGADGVTCVPAGTNDSNHVFVFTSDPSNSTGVDHAFYIAVIGS